MGRASKELTSGDSQLGGDVRGTQQLQLDGEPVEPRVTDLRRKRGGVWAWYNALSDGTFQH